MNYLSICSGIEAATTAWHGLGWKPLGFSEIEPFPSAVLAHHWPDVINLGDMTKYEQWNIDRAATHLLVGGTPCQAFSVAGLRRGLADARGNLSLTFCHMADHFDPEWVLWENVPGVLSSKDNAFGCFLAGLCGASEPLTPNGRWASAGVVSGPKRTVAWRILDAQFFGVAQRRRRIFVLAVRGAGNWRAAAALFPIAQGMFWDSAPRRKARQVAPSSSARGTFECGGIGSYNISPVSSPLLRTGADKGPGCEALITLAGEKDGEVTASRMVAFGEYVSDGTASALKARDYKDATDLVTHTLRGDGFDASEDGKGRGTPLVPVGVTIHGTDKTAKVASYAEIAGCLRADVPGRIENSSTTVVQQPVAFHLTQDPISSQDGSTHALGCGSSKGQGTVAVAAAMQVRRLTPRECERLQGFPDDHTLIPWRGKPADQCPDGPRYKALGNSMAVPVMRWIGERIQLITKLFPHD